MKVKVKRKFDPNLLTVAVIILLAAVFMIDSKTYVETTFFGLKLWATAVLPSILPFYFLTGVFTMTGYVEKISSKLAPVARLLYKSNGICVYIKLMSVLCGYPMGAKIISDLYKKGAISASEAEKYCTFTSTAGPIYIVGSIAIGMFGSSKIGLILIISHLVSSALTGIIFRNMPVNGTIAPFLSNKNNDDVLYEAMHQAIQSALMVGGFSAVFYTFGQIAVNLRIFEPLSILLSPILGKELTTALFSGLIECTTGALLISELPLSRLSLSVVSGLIAFGGLSVWFQTIGYLSIAKVRKRFFILSKLTHSVIAFLICYILSALA